jgi:hypothetical protein
VNVLSDFANNVNTLRDLADNVNTLPDLAKLAVSSQGRQPLECVWQSWDVNPEGVIETRLIPDVLLVVLHPVPSEE